MCSCMVWFHYGKIFHCMSSSSLVLLSRCSVSISSGRVFFHVIQYWRDLDFWNELPFSAGWADLFFACLRFAYCSSETLSWLQLDRGSARMPADVWLANIIHTQVPPQHVTWNLKVRPIPMNLKKETKNFICKDGSQEYDCFIKFTHYSDETQTFA